MSRVEAATVISATALYNGSIGTIYPIHPLKFPFFVRVTNAPLFSSNRLSCTSSLGMLPFAIYSSSTLRAMVSKVFLFLFIE